jgi:hypothetical protein
VPDTDGGLKSFSVSELWSASKKSNVVGTIPENQCRPLFVTLGLIDA